MKLNRAVIGALALSILLGGCASTADYNIYAQGQAQIEAAKYAAEAAKYNAMAQIASSGSESSKIAAVMAMVMGGGSGSGQSTQLRAPESPGATALAWASILVPSLTQGYAIYSNTKLGMAQSNNSARVSESTNSAFVGMGNSIQAAGSSGNTALASLATSSNRSLVSLAGQIQAPQPNISYTLSGTGVLGSGTYSTSSLGGNGVIGSGTYSTQANPVTTSSQYTLSGTGVLGNGTNAPRTQTPVTTTTNNLAGTGTIGGGQFTPNTTTTVTPPPPAASAP
jgi:hypothetical protein